MQIKEKSQRLYHFLGEKIQDLNEKDIMSVLYLYLWKKKRINKLFSIKLF